MILNIILMLSQHFNWGLENIIINEGYLEILEEL